MKIPNNREFQQIIHFHSQSFIHFKDFMKTSKIYTAGKYSILVNGTTLPSNNPLRFRMNI